MDPAQVIDLEHDMEISEDVLRHLLINLVAK
jgi:ribosomal protein S6